jgi:hypothetical protein
MAELSPRQLADTYGRARNEAVPDVKVDEIGNVNSVSND